MTQFSGMNGLMQLVTDADIYTYVYDLARADNPQLNGIRDHHASGTQRAFNEDFLNVMVDRISDEGKGEDPDVLLTSKAIRREYVKDTKGDRRFESVQTEKGYKELVYHAGDTMLPIKTAKRSVPGCLFVLNTKGFGYLEESPLGPIDSQTERFVADKDAREINLHKSGNIYTESNLNNGVIEDISFDVAAAT